MITDVAALEKALTLTEKQLQREVGEAKAIASRVKQDILEAKELDEKSIALEEAIGIMNSFADKRQQDIQNKIELLVTHGLQTIFDQSLSFHIIQQEKARRVESSFVIRSKLEDGTVVETGILDARGGGVASVAGFLLRLIISLLRKEDRHFLLLDESFSMVSDHYEAKLVEFVKELVDKTDIQIVLITHKGADEWCEVADRAYHFSLKDGKTVVKELKADA